MPRPEKKISPDAPYGDFARSLRQLRDRAGNPPYEAMAARIQNAYSASTLAHAASGTTLPTLNVTLAYARACNDDNRQKWAELWRLAATKRGPWAAGTSPVGPPNPDAALTPAEYVALLRELRLWAGQPPFDRLARLTGASRSTLADACARNRTTLPTPTVVNDLLQGCLQYASRIHGHTHPALQQARWIQAWHRLQEQELQKRQSEERLHSEIPSTELAEPHPTPGPGSHASSPPRRGRPRGPLAPYIREERRALALALRELVDLTGETLTRISMACMHNPSAVSRYLAGHRVPPRHFLERLLHFLESHGAPHTARHAYHEHLLALHTAALRASHSPLLITQLEDELREAHAQVATLRAHGMPPS